MTIDPINFNLLQSSGGPASVGKNRPAGKSAPVQSDAGFGETIGDALGQLDQMQRNSDVAIQKLASGENVDLHEVMVAVEQTDIAFRVALSLRDKLVEAYQEVMRMQI